MPQVCNRMALEKVPLPLAERIPQKSHRNGLKDEMRRQCVGLAWSPAEFVASRESNCPLSNTTGLQKIRITGCVKIPLSLHVKLVQLPKVL